MEAETTWKYSGESDLILLDSAQEFSDAVVFDIEAMLNDGAIDTVGGLLEAVIGFAHSRGSSSSAYMLSDREGVRTFSESAVEAITALLPTPLQRFWKKGLHYRVRNLARA